MGISRTIVAVMLLGSLTRADPRTLHLGWRHEGSRSYAEDRFRAYRNPPEGVHPLDDDEVWYVDHELAPGKVLLAAANPDAKPPQAWIDLDLDGQLDDEKPVALEVDGARLLVQVALDWRDAEGEAPHPLPVSLAWDRDLKDGYVRLRVRGHREGEGVLGGRVRKIAAISGSTDLRLDDPDCDRIYVDLDGDGRIERGEKSPERVLPGKAFRVGREGYVLRLGTVTGATLLLERVAPAPPVAPRPWPKPSLPPRVYPRQISTTQPLDELIADYEEWKADPLGFGSMAEQELYCIGSKGSPRSVRFLLKVARKEKDAALRRVAAEALGNKYNRPQAKLVMAAVRKERDPELATALLRAIEAMDALNRSEFYLDLLEDTKQDEVRAECADLVAAAGGAGRRALADRIGKLRTPEAEFHAYRAATRFDSAPPPVELVEAALASKDVRLRMMALRDTQWLGRRETFAEFVALAAEEVKRHRVDGPLARLIVETLGPVAGPAEIPLLFEGAAAASTETTNRLVDLLRPVRDPATIAAIRAELDSRVAARRSVAVRVLARIPGEGNEEALVRRLATEREREVCLPLISALGRRGAAAAADALIKVASRGKKDAELSEAARIALARIGFESRAVEKYFADEASDRAWVRRLDAVDVVARYAGASAVPFLAKRFGDEEWRVRVAAAQGLGRLRAKEGIGPLIAALESEQDKRVRRAVADALFRTTGQHLYDFYDLWVKWWSRNHASFEVPARVPEKSERKSNERKTVATFYGIPVESERVVFVIDRSGSMGGEIWISGFQTKERKEKNNLEKAVDETIKVADRMRDDARINVVFFDTSTQRWSDKLVKLTKASRARLRTYLKRQNPGGGTNLYDGLELAMRMRDVDTVYLLSDGSPSAGKYVEDEDILREIGKLNKQLRIQIHCISLGYGSDLLKRLAEQTGGTYAERR